MRLLYYTDQVYMHGGLERVLANKLNYFSELGQSQLPESIELVKKWQEKGCETLIEAVDVQSMKSDLDELRLGGNTDEIVKKEMEKKT